MIGGGYVSLEMAQAYRRFGGRVTIVEQGPQIAGREDAEVAETIQRIFNDEGIDVLVGTETLEVSGNSGRRVSVHVRTATGGETIDGSDILVARDVRPIRPESDWKRSASSWTRAAISR